MKGAMFAPARRYAF